MLTGAATTALLPVFPDFEEFHLIVEAGVLEQKLNVFARETPAEPFWAVRNIEDSYRGDTGVAFQRPQVNFVERVGAGRPLLPARRDLGVETVVGPNLRRSPLRAGCKYFYPATSDHFTTRFSSTAVRPMMQVNVAIRPQSALFNGSLLSRTLLKNASTARWLASRPSSSM